MAGGNNTPERNRACRVVFHILVSTSLSEMAQDHQLSELCSTVDKTRLLYAAQRSIKLSHLYSLKCSTNSFLPMIIVVWILDTLLYLGNCLLCFYQTRSSKGSGCVLLLSITLVVAPYPSSTSFPSSTQNAAASAIPTMGF